MDKLKVYKNNIKKNNKGNVYKYIEISKSFKNFRSLFFKDKKKFNQSLKKQNIKSIFYIFDGKIILKFL